MFMEAELEQEGAAVSAPVSTHVGRKGAHRVYIPEGSLAAFPKGVNPVHCSEEARSYRDEGWYTHISKACTLTFADGVLARTLNRSLAEQRALLAFRGGPMEPLSPYELAYLAALWRERGEDRLFKGRVRTFARKNQASTSYLGGGDLTVTAEYSRGMLRFFYEYERCRHKALGLLAGIRTL